MTSNAMAPPPEAAFTPALALCHERGLVEVG